MTTINISVDLPKNIGDFSAHLNRLRTRKQVTLIRAIQEHQQDDKMGEEVQIKFGARKINIKQASDTTRLVRRFGTKVFAQRWSAVGTGKPPLDRVVNEIMGNLHALAPRWPGEKSRSARYADSFRIYRRQSGESELRYTGSSIGPEGWDSDTMFVISNLISYASSLEAHEFMERGQGIMHHAAQMASRRYPFVGVRFRYYQENRFPPADYAAANSDLGLIRYYAIPVIEIGRASLVRKPSRRPGVRSGLSRSALSRRQQNAARNNLRRARRR